MCVCVDLYVSSKWPFLKNENQTSQRTHTHTHSSPFTLLARRFPNFKAYTSNTFTFSQTQPNDRQQKLNFRNARSVAFIWSTYLCIEVGVCLFFIFFIFFILSHRFLYAYANAAAVTVAVTAATAVVVTVAVTAAAHHQRGVFVCVF